MLRVLFPLLVLFVLLAGCTKKTEQPPKQQADAIDVVEEMRKVVHAMPDFIADWGKGRCPEGMSRVPGGKVQVYMAGERWGGVEVRTQTLTPFCIDIFEASQPDATAQSAGSWKNPVVKVDDTPEQWNYPAPMARSVHGVLPWVNISQMNAEKACKAAGKRLATLAEWQMAYSGPASTLWPWGNDWEKNTCNANLLSPVEAPTGRCCYSWKVDNREIRTCDMVGNVSEWIADRWQEECFGPDEVMIAGGSSVSSHTIHNGQNPVDEKPGCWKFVSYSLTRTGLHHHPKTVTLADDGFRCAKNLQ